MCGIVGYIGPRQAYDVLVKGLKRLEYRGYDSAGIALGGAESRIYKCKGKVSDLENKLSSADITGSIGMGHTRWATHGEPNDTNAHPHQSMLGKFVIIHNGIIENYSKLKIGLQAAGYKFNSETDTEVLANLIEYVFMQNQNNGDSMNAEEAVRAALNMVEGAYGLVVMSENMPDKLIAARKGSPLVVGIGVGEYFIASDATPIIEYTNSVIYLNDDDIAVIGIDGLNLTNLKNVKQKPNVKQIDLKLDEIEKNGFDHYMLKEIYEQPRAIRDTYRGRLNYDSKFLRLGGLHNVFDEIKDAKRIMIIACGTSWHAGLVGEYLFEEFTRIPTEVEYASEFRYRNPVLGKQ